MPPETRHPWRRVRRRLRQILLEPRKSAAPSIVCGTCDVARARIVEKRMTGLLVNLQIVRCGKLLEECAYVCRRDRCIACAVAAQQRGGDRALRRRLNAAVKYGSSGKERGPGDLREYDRASHAEARDADL